ncbi:hypothetical protein Glove_110g48 [Diversispora epigaea]|uniref:Uncharacterized protein n=1 Tax=Diversispora epigaea TaxID=1348612 RepID=A0A397J490_9GLOM|nr:hypothetical protein Glove_110g48 [Diversispora epigaea]
MSSIFNKLKDYQGKGKHTVDDSVESQMEGISYDTSATQQSSQSGSLDLFKDNISSYPCINKSVVEEDALTQHSRINWFKFSQSIKLKFIQNKLTLPQIPDDISEEIKSSISNFIPIKNFSCLQSVRNILGQHYIIDQLPISFFHELYKPNLSENNNNPKTNTFKSCISLKPSLPFNPREVNKQLNIPLPITNTNDIVPIKNLL